MPPAQKGNHPLAQLVAGVASSPAQGWHRRRIQAALSLLPIGSGRAAAAGQVHQLRYRVTHHHRHHPCHLVCTQTGLQTSKWRRRGRRLMLQAGQSLRCPPDRVARSTLRHRVHHREALQRTRQPISQPALPTRSSTTSIARSAMPTQGASRLLIASQRTPMPSCLSGLLSRPSPIASSRFARSSTPPRESH